MGHIEGASRVQHILLPEALDDDMTEDRAARFMDAFVDSLDLHALGFQRTEPAPTGRPSDSPGALRKLYIYGCMNRIRSSRQLEKETHRNVALLWLLRKLPPACKTLADFRQDQGKAFKQVFRAFVLLCKEWGLFGQELVAIDGSQFTAVNSKPRNFTQAKLHEALKRVDGPLEQYLHDWDTADAAEAERQKPTAEGLPEKLRHLRERKGRFEGLRREMEGTGQSQVSLTDPDSRSMPKRPKVAVGYTVQVAVDAQHQLFGVPDVTNAVTDVDQLSGIALQAKEAFGVDQRTVVADMGDYHGEGIKACVEAGIEPSVAKPLTSANRKLGLYGTEPFTYEPEHDCYRGPAGQALPFRFANIELGRPIRYDATTACRACAIKARCTRNKEGRRITRWVHEHIPERMQKRVEANPVVTKRRQQIVEHPFGTIKHWHDQGYCLMKGLERVRAEFSLSTLAYNLRRVVTIFGVPHRVRALA